MVCLISRALSCQCGLFDYQGCVLWVWFVFLPGLSLVSVVCLITSAESCECDLFVYQGCVLWVWFVWLPGLSLVSVVFLVTRAVSCECDLFVSLFVQSTWFALVQDEHALLWKYGKCALLVHVLYGSDLACRQGWASVLFKRTQCCCILLRSFQKNEMFLHSFAFFIKRTLRSLHFYTFFIKERYILCVLLCSLLKNAVFFAYFYVLYKRMSRSLRSFTYFIKEQNNLSVLFCSL